MADFDNKELLVRTSESTKQAHRRIDKIEIEVKNIHDISASVKEIAVEMREMRIDMTDINTRLKDIEKKPNKYWDTIINTVISVTIGGIIGALLALILI